MCAPKRAPVSKRVLSRKLDRKATQPRTWRAWSGCRGCAWLKAVGPSQTLPVSVHTERQEWKRKKHSHTPRLPRTCDWLNRACTIVVVGAFVAVALSGWSSFIALAVASVQAAARVSLAAALEGVYAGVGTHGAGLVRRLILVVTASVPVQPMRRDVHCMRPTARVVTHEVDGAAPEDARAFQAPAGCVSAASSGTSSGAVVLGPRHEIVQIVVVAGAAPALACRGQDDERAVACCDHSCSEPVGKGTTSAAPEG